MDMKISEETISDIKNWIENTDKVCVGADAKGNAYYQLGSAEALFKYILISNGVEL